MPGASEDTDYLITKTQLLAGFTDADAGEGGDSLVIDQLNAYDNNNNIVGQFTPDDAANPTQWTFTPDTDFNGLLSINYNVVDAQQGSVSASLDLDIAAVNDAPELTVASQHSFDDSPEDSPITITKDQLLAGFFDDDEGETETLSILGLSATGGVITLVGDDYAFTPNPDFNGEVELNYVVSDGNGGNLIAQNTLNITPLNDAPVRTAGNVSTLFLVEDAPMSSMGLEDLSYTVGGGPDESAAQTLTYTVDVIPDTQFGVVYSINQEDSTGGNLTGVLDASAGASEFTFGPSVITDADGNQITVNPDGSGDATSVAGLTITDPATGAWSLDLGSDAMYSLLADQRLEIVGSYEYADGGNTVSNEYIIYVEKAANGDQKTTLLTGVDQGQELSLVQLQNLQFLAAENAYGSTEFTYVVSDGGLDDADNTNSIRETVNLDILGFNDTPVLPTDASGNVTITLTPATEDAEYTLQLLSC